MLEKEAFEDLDLTTIPSTAKTACDSTSTANNAIDCLIKKIFELVLIVIAVTKLTKFIKYASFTP